MVTTSRSLIVLLAAGSLATGGGAAAIWHLNTANEPTDAGRRPAFGTTAEAGQGTAATVYGGRGDGLRSPALPAALSVPSVELRAAVVPVGLDRAGAMALPGDVSRVGWYRYGPRPGSAAGSAVLAGHIDSREQGVGALAALRHVSPGARLAVRLADGRDVNYRVVSREFIAKKAMPLDVFFAPDGRPRLTVITCGGPFDARLGHYRDNLVVTAVPVQPPP